MDSQRYKLAAPVPGGYAYWDINDMETMRSLVTISKDFPDAEAEIKKLYEKLLTNAS